MNPREFQQDGAFDRMRAAGLHVPANTRPSALKDARTDAESDAKRAAAQAKRQRRAKRAG